MIFTTAFLLAVLIDVLAFGAGFGIMVWLINNSGTPPHKGDE